MTDHYFKHRIMADQLEKAKSVKRKYESGWLRIDKVVAVGIGLVEGRGTGIIISVEEETETIRKRIPETIESVPVKILKTGVIRAE